MKTIIVSAKNKMGLVHRIPRLLAILAFLLAVVSGCSANSSLQTQSLSEPLGGATTAKIEIDPGDGNLTIDTIANSEAELVSGELQYLENQGQPTRTVDRSGSPAILTLKAKPGKQPWIRLPWVACNGATDWLVHLNPKLTADLTAHTDGGNVKLNLTGLVLTNLLADTGGGNIELALPDQTTSLNATVKTGAGNINVAVGSGLSGSSTLNASSGAGNVLVRLPQGLAARIRTNSGMGKIIIDSRFNKIDDTTYQSTGYENAVDRVEMTLSSGAGNVTLETH